MSPLTWLTPQGTLANMAVGVPTDVQLQAVDVDQLMTLTVPTGQSGVAQTITYSIIEGTLPPGMTLATVNIGDDINCQWVGKIVGTPEYSIDGGLGYFGTMNFDITVRARSEHNQIVDGKFRIFLRNTLTADFNWTTPAGQLGHVVAFQWYSFPIRAVDSTGGKIQYKVISGELPIGMQLDQSGNLIGVPTMKQTSKVGTIIPLEETYRFTVRATNSQGKVTDRGFDVTVSYVFGLDIQPNAPLEYEYDSVTGLDKLSSYPPGIVILGSFFDGSWYEKDLYLPEVSPTATVKWSIASGTLPDGLSLSADGKISGYILPLQLVGEFGPAGYDGDSVIDGVIVQEQEYDTSPYQFSQLNQSLNYTFTVQASDGANATTRSYMLKVVSRTNWKTDSSLLLNDSYITLDAISQYPPVIRNTSKILPTARANSYYAFKFDGYDFQGDDFTYIVSNTLGTFDAYIYGQDQGFDYAPFDSYDERHASSTNLPGLLLDAQTGWLYGKLLPQTQALQNYVFGVQVTKVKDEITLSSEAIYFTLPVLGDINNTIKWITDSELGTINNGSVSEFSIVAKSTENRDIVYKLVDRQDIPCRLPQGLILLPTGNIGGRVTFESFEIDDYSTTFDNEKLTFDRDYHFFVEASTADGTSSSIKDFTLKLNIIDKDPYNNLYLQATPKFDQRQIYNSVINDQEIFNPELIYRKDDPWFGIQKNMEMLFMSGLNARDLAEYQTAMAKNHFTKTYNFGDIKTAVVLDDNYKIKYEVVYIEVNDPGETTAGTGPVTVPVTGQHLLELNLTGIIANPYVDTQGNTSKTVYPNTTANMKKRLEQGIGYQDQSSLPSWMTSNQPRNDGTGTFDPPLGYTKAIAMAYTKPGASKLIAFRLRSTGIKFNAIQFNVDRYIVESFYSSNYNYTTKSYYSGNETTFDTLPKNVGTIVARVDYGSVIEYDQINGRPVSYIVSRGGIDGKIDFQDGDSLIFIQQEGYYNAGPYDGWVNYTNAYLGDDILTTAVEGYDAAGYDTYSVVPGFLEKAQGTSEKNQRSGVWIIRIINGIVNLIFDREIEVNQRVQILRGATYSGAVMYYNPILSPGQSVPFYSVYKLNPISVKKKTTFNGNSTRFFTKRDTYYEPGKQDKYLKFPQIGAFH